MILVDSHFFLKSLTTGSSWQSQMEFWLQQHESISIESLSYYEVLIQAPDNTNQETLASIFSNPEPILPEDVITATILFKKYTGHRSLFRSALTAAVALRLQSPLACASPETYQIFKNDGLILLTAPTNNS